MTTLDGEFKKILREALGSYKSSFANAYEESLILIIKQKGACLGIACSADDCPFIVECGNSSNGIDHPTKYNEAVKLYLKDHSVEDLVEILI